MRTHPPIGLVTIQVGIELRAGKDFQETNGNVRQSSDDEGFGSELQGICIGEVETPKDIWDTPGKNLIKSAAKSGNETLVIGQCGR